ncbi:RIPOR family member 3-like [Halichondria panicea]|uniref:RIPOR family member 3-like n=1 Tax=Halichondria panicea TaxID=6063 RepID=UPI00312B67D5
MSSVADSSIGDSSTTQSTGSSASKTSLSSLHEHDRFMASPPSFNPTPLSFANRRGNIKFSSARYYPGSKSLRGSKRGRSGLVSSFRGSKRAQRSAPRPARCKVVFEKLLQGLTEGIAGVKARVEEMKSKLQETRSRVNYFMEQEKQIKLLERKTRTLEVHKDRIEEMRDEYTLKIKLRDGAFNLAQALSSQASKVSKEKLIEARLEQRELLDDLCDIEDELETKLGVFKVHINGLVGLSNVSNSEGVETHLKLATQKWKAKCKHSKHEQSWTDENIIFLGKVTDELFLKVVELKKIQGNVQLGAMKCQTREFLSFYPMNVTFDFPSSPVKLNMDITWSPTLGGDFLTDLDLPTVNCIVGGAALRSTNFGSVERRGAPSLSGSDLDHHTQLRIITEPEDTEVTSNNSVGRSEVKTNHILRRSKRKKKDNQDFVFLDRKSLILNTDEVRQYPEAKSLMDREASPDPDRVLSRRVQEIELGPSSHKNTRKDSRDSSLGSSHSSGSTGNRRSSIRQTTPSDSITVVGMLEVVMALLEEPREVYPELAGLESQLTRLEVALNGGRLVKLPSMTLSESLAMDSFDFLGSEDTAASQRFSMVSMSDASEDYPFLHHRRSGSNFSASGRMDLRQSSQVSQASQDSQTTDDTMSDVGSFASEGGVRCGGGSTGCVSVDRAILQHLIHCDCLLQHLQSAGPLNYKLRTGLLKLQQEAEILAELLNIAAEPDVPVLVDHIIPELAANESLLKFWKYVSGSDLLSVSYEKFAVALDEKFGQIMWVDFPQTANKAFTELLSRVLDLDIDDWEPSLDSQMVVTLFQYAAFFLVQGSTGIQKCLKDVAQELNVTEGLLSYDDEHVRFQIADQLRDHGYNKGALLAAAHLLTDSRSSILSAAVSYVKSFEGNSPWHNKAVQYYVELLENADQKIRAGACRALGYLQASGVVPQLKYISKKDFPTVREAACKALQALGVEVSSESGGSVHSVDPASSSKQQQVSDSPIKRTRSADQLTSDTLV